MKRPRGKPRAVLPESMVEAFCVTPRTVKEMCDEFNLSGTIITRVTEQMIEAGILVKWQEKAAATAKWRFTLAKNRSKNIWSFDTPPFKAHDPFNLIKRK